MLTIFPEVVKLTWALLDTLNGTSCLGEVNEAMLRLQGTMDKAPASSTWTLPASLQRSTGMRI